jgi:hypothetical protein
MEDKASVLERFNMVVQQVRPDPLDKLMSLPPQDRQVTVIEPDPDGNDARAVREGIYRALGKVETAFDDITAIARQSQHPRAFEVANQLAKTLMDGFASLLDTKKKAQEVGPGPTTIKNEDGGTTTINNNTLLLTSNEVFDHIKKLVKEQS